MKSSRRASACLKILAGVFFGGREDKSLNEVLMWRFQFFSKRGYASLFKEFSQTTSRYLPILFCLCLCSSFIGAPSIARSQEGNYLIQSYPKKWQKLGMPLQIDRSEKLQKPLKKYDEALTARIMECKSTYDGVHSSATDDDFDIVASLLPPVKGQSDQFSSLAATLASGLCGFEKDPRCQSLIGPLRQLLKQRDILISVRCFTAGILGDLKDGASAPDILELQAEVESSGSIKNRDVWKERIAHTLRQLGYEMAFEEDKPKPVTNGKK